MSNDTSPQTFFAMRRSALRAIRKALAGGLTAIAVLHAVPALADSGAEAKLVRCGAQSCLQVTGHRDDASAPVRINGHLVAVQGQRNWRANLSVGTIKEWSAPFDRHIVVTSYDAAAQRDTDDKVRLPIGLLGHVPDLASLVITLD